LNSEIAISILAIVVTVAISIGGYVLKGINKTIEATMTSARDMHESAKQATRDAEARCMAQIKDTEARAEKGDERVLAHVNSQFSEVNQQLREIRALLTDSKREAHA
jgi:CHASE3 domain sensor protein